MYNGVGLRTVRGSGTNGYVQTNKAYVRPANVSSREWKAKTQAPANPQLLEHARKRAIEVKVYELRDVLEDQGLDESEIEKRCADLRASLREGAAPSKKVDTHAAAEIKARDDARIRAAFGIDPEKFVEGAAFDRELQEQRRQARKAQHERYLVENEKKAERDRLKALEREEQREKDRKAGDREEGEEIEEEREDRRRKRVDDDHSAKKKPRPDDDQDDQDDDDDGPPRNNEPPLPSSNNNKPLTSSTKKLAKRRSPSVSSTDSSDSSSSSSDSSSSSSSSSTTSSSSDYSSSSSSSSKSSSSSSSSSSRS